MSLNLVTIRTLLFSLLCCSIVHNASAETGHNAYLSSGSTLLLVQSHAGQMDTDGILSPGELRNPNIDYDRAQHQHEIYDDDRVDNPYNDDAADAERAAKERADREYEYRQRQDDNRYYEHRHHSRDDW